MKMPYENIELLLCENGFGEIYEGQMSGQKARPTADRGTAEYWRQVLKALPTRGFSKPAAAAEAVDRMTKATVPEPLVKILNKAVALAKPS